MISENAHKRNKKVLYLAGILIAITWYLFKIHYYNMP